MEGLRGPERVLMVKVARRAQGGEADLRFDRRAMLPERSAMATVAAVRAEIPSGTPLP